MGTDPGERVHVRLVPGTVSTNSFVPGVYEVSTKGGSRVDRPVARAAMTTPATFL